MINKAILIGNLGSDPETRFIQDGTCVCNLRVATSERFKDRNGEMQERVEWHRVVLWGRLAEIANEYLQKGARVYIEGKIETRKWVDRDGNDRYTTEIKASNMKMLSGKGEEGNRGGRASPTPERGANRAGTSDQRDPFSSEPPADDGLYDDDIPF